MSKLLRRSAAGGVQSSVPALQASALMSVGGQSSCHTVVVGDSGKGVLAWALPPLPSPLLLSLLAWYRGMGVVALVVYWAGAGRGLRRNSASAWFAAARKIPRLGSCCTRSSRCAETSSLSSRSSELWSVPSKWSDSVLLVLLRRSCAIAVVVTAAGFVEEGTFGLILLSVMRLDCRGIVEECLCPTLIGWPLLACKRAEFGAWAVVCLLGVFAVTVCLGEHGREVQLADIDCVLALLTEDDLGLEGLEVRLVALLRRLLLPVVAGLLGLDGAVVVVNLYPGTPKTLGELSNLLLPVLLFLLGTPLSGDAGQLLALLLMAWVLACCVGGCAAAGMSEVLLRSPRTVGRRLLTMGELLWVAFPRGAGVRDGEALVRDFELQPTVGIATDGGRSAAWWVASVRVDGGSITGTC